MADTKISNLTEATSLVDADEFPVITDTGTTPVTKRSLLSTLVTYLQTALKTYFDTIYQNSQVIGGNALSGTVGAGATNYLAPFSDTFGTTVNQTNWPKAGTVKNLTVRLASTQPATGTLVITLQVAGSDSALVVTIPAGSTAGNYSDTTHTVSISAMNALRWKVVNNASGSSGQIQGITMEITP